MKKQEEEIKGNWKIITSILSDRKEYTEKEDEEGKIQKRRIANHIEKEFVIIHLPTDTVVKRIVSSLHYTAAGDYHEGPYEVYFSEDGKYAIAGEEYSSSISNESYHLDSLL